MVNICCSIVSQLGYEEEIGSVTVPVKFYWDETKLLDNPDNVTGTDYLYTIMSSYFGP